MGGIGGKKNIKNNVSGTGFGLRRTLNEYINQKSIISVLFTISPSSLKNDCTIRKICEKKKNNV